MIIKRNGFVKEIDIDNMPVGTLGECYDCGKPFRADQRNKRVDQYGHLYHITCSKRAVWKGVKVFVACCVIYHHVYIPRTPILFKKGDEVEINYGGEMFNWSDEDKLRIMGSVLEALGSI